MKKWLFSFVGLMTLLSFAGYVQAIPEPPEMSYTTNGLHLTISWNEVTNATGYKLYYAPYPYTGSESIRNIDVGRSITTSYYLSKGAAYYIAVKSYDDLSESDYSNIEYFIMGPPNPDWIDNDGDGYHENEGDCNDNNLSISPEAEDFCGDGIDQNCDGNDKCTFSFDLPVSAKIQFFSGLFKETILALDNTQVWQVNAGFSSDYSLNYVYTQVPATIYEFDDKIYMLIQGTPKPIGVHLLEVSSMIESKVLFFEGLKKDTILELENGQIWQVDSNFQYSLHTPQPYELLPMTIYEVNGKHLMTILGSYLTAVVHKLQ